MFKCLYLTKQQANAQVEIITESDSTSLKNIQRLYGSNISRFLYLILLI